MKTPRHSNHVVYEIVAADDTVLYVGTTGNIHDRLNTHRFLAPWWDDMAHCRITPCRNRVEALDLETELIGRHHPVHNVDGNPVFPRRERGTVIESVLRLLRENGPMTTTEVRIALGEYHNASAILHRLHADGIVNEIDRVPSHGNARWTKRWAIGVTDEAVA